MYVLRRSGRSHFVPDHIGLFVAPFVGRLDVDRAVTDPVSLLQQGPGAPLYSGHFPDRQAVDYQVCLQRIVAFVERPDVDMVNWVIGSIPVRASDPSTHQILGKRVDRVQAVVELDRDLILRKTLSQDAFIAMIQ